MIAVLFLAPRGATAHDVPNDVTVQAFVKPTGDRLHLLVRVPLKVIRDRDFPERDQGYRDLARVDILLGDAATLWFSDFIEIYEDNIRLPNPRVVETRLSLESDKSFASYEEALTHLTGPRLSNETNVFCDQTMLDVLFEYPIRSDRSYFSIYPGLASLGLRVVTVLLAA